MTLYRLSPHRFYRDMRFLHTATIMAKLPYMEQVKIILAVACGGAVGAVLRWAISFAFNLVPIQFPRGTFIANMIGCLLIGLLVALNHKNHMHPILFTGLVTGMIGALTTFSTFCLENTDRFKTGAWPLALMDISTSILLGLAMVWLGMVMGHGILSLLNRNAPA